MNAEPVKNIPADVNTRRWKNLKLKVHESQIEKAWKRYENAGFKPLLIKGWAAAQYYTEPSDRQFSDIDLVFAPEEFERAEKASEEWRDTLAIDLHKGTRHLDTLSFETLYANSQTIKCGNTAIRVLRREDHLRILCVHWLTDGGAKKDKLWDIYYAVQTRPADFNWDECLGAVSQTRRIWILCVIALARKYLALEITDTPFESSLPETPQWLTAAAEKEWRDASPLIPLHFTLNNPKTLWQQIKKRIPPNPIQATVEMEGNFDDRTRIFYQFGDFFYRLLPSFKRILKE